MARAKVENKRISISLPPDQIEWLQEQKAGISGTLRGLVTEAMELANLQKAARQIRERRGLRAVPAPSKKAAPSKKKPPARRG